MLDHCLGVAGYDGVDNPQRFGFRVIPERLRETDFASGLTEGLQALFHRGDLDVRGIDHHDLPALARIVLGFEPVAVHRVKDVLAALRAEHPVDGVATGIADTVLVVGVTESPRLTFADPAFHASLTAPMTVCPSRVRVVEQQREPDKQELPVRERQSCRRQCWPWP